LLQPCADWKSLRSPDVSAFMHTRPLPFPPMEIPLPWAVCYAVEKGLAMSGFHCYSRTGKRWGLGNHLTLFLLSFLGQELVAVEHVLPTYLMSKHCRRGTQQVLVSTSKAIPFLWESCKSCFRELGGEFCLALTGM